MNYKRSVWASSMLASALLAPLQTTHAVIVTDNFTGASSANTWLRPESDDGSVNTACMTASDGTGMPKCSLSEAVGSGALQLTSSGNYQHGSIVSATSFPSNEGLQVTFTTYIYGGTYRGTGADGITFFLADGNQEASTGATGGALGYSCSNGNPFANGVVGGYLGLGIDEFGNFLNATDNTVSGFGFQPGRIGLRGAGSIAWKSLSTTYPTHYPSSANPAAQRTAVQATCSTGLLQHGTAKGNGDFSWAAVSPATPLLDYAALPMGYSILPSTQPIGNIAATTRANATPISYKLKITQDGHLSLWYSYNSGVYQTVLDNQSITASNGLIPAQLRFGFSGSTGGQNNIHEITCFKATPSSISYDSAVLSLPTGEYKTGAQIYQAKYFPDNWWGALTSTNLLYNKSTGGFSFSTIANWDASCVLTGGLCTSTGATVTTAAQTTRQVLSWNGNQGVKLSWSEVTDATTLTDAQQAVLNTNDQKGSDRLAYLRGDRSNERNSSGLGIFRARSSVLGDIISSSPTWVGPPSAAYPTSSHSLQTVWDDRLHPGTQAENGESAQTYEEFQSAQGRRENLVYVGSNDGLLHGFRSGSYKANGEYDDLNTIANDGHESLAYMPAAIVHSIHNSTIPGKDFSSPNYAHNYFVDATPESGDLFYNGSWHTWLIGGLGAGGQAIYILDITDPTSFSEANASSLVIGEWAYSATTTSLWNKLGLSYGTPQIRRFHNGQWGAVFGNGWCRNEDSNCIASSNGHAGIYVMSVNSSGKPSFQFIDTGSGNGGSPNGIAYVTPADLDGDHITDYVYAGDLKGQVWRFDLTSNLPAEWSVSTRPLFKTENDQPIFTKLTVSAATPVAGGDPRLMINFGTGTQLPQTLTSEATYANSTQALYGIWDWDMQAWNDRSESNFEQLPANNKTAPIATLAKSDLTPQSANINGTNNRPMSNNPVCWSGKTSVSCGSNTRFGWYIDLGSKTIDTKEIYEQVIFNPIVAVGALLVNTSLPPTNSPATCNATSSTGWTIAVDPATGVGLPGFFSGSATDMTGYAEELNAIGSPSVVSVFGRPIMINQTISQEGKATPLNPNSTGKRISWIQLR